MEKSKEMFIENLYFQASKESLNWIKNYLIQNVRFGVLTGCDVGDLSLVLDLT